MKDKLPWSKPELTNIEELHSIVKVWTTPVVESIKMNMSFVMSPYPVKPCGCPPGPCVHSPAGYYY